MHSSDGKSRDLVSSIEGNGWDHGLNRHPYFEIERPLKPHYCVYNRRLMACCFSNHISTEEGYWLLRQKAALLNTGEYCLSFKGPDAETLLDRLFTKNIKKLRIGRCGYGLACYHDGGMLVDGILVRLSDDHFWYAQADGDFYSWARAHAKGLNVEISDPEIFVSQIQGPHALKILEKICDAGIPENFTYFASAEVIMDGQKIIITRTGYTNELGFEFYTEPHHDAIALWAHIHKAGEEFGLKIFGLDSMNIRRIEAGILNAGSDFNHTTTPYDVGLGRFIDEDKDDFIGRDALKTASRKSKLIGVQCMTSEPLINGAIIDQDGMKIGQITAGVHSPYLGCGIGIALMDHVDHMSAPILRARCKDYQDHNISLVELPFYDKLAEIPRGKLVDIPIKPK